MTSASDATVAILIRDVPVSVTERFRRAARLRGISQAEYLARLVALHDEVRAWADGETAVTPGPVRRTLEALGLQSVRE
jgi:hypothetical protein